MAEQLLNIDQVARKLGVTSRKTVQRHMHQLREKGLEVVTWANGRVVKFRESSLDRMIRRSAERGEPLF